LNLEVRDMTDADQAAVEALDTSFETNVVFDVVTAARGVSLVERRLVKPLVKHYPMADAFSHWASWDTGFVATDHGVIVGFAGVEFEAWHRRLVLWHLYVQPSHRRRGVGRALLAHVEDFGRQRRAERVWLETTSVNVPGILAYERLGYSLCGADVTMYDGLPYAHETALFMAKSLSR
jgi:ribosomal protein S18 acetylase RimI-like enzyme